MKEAPIGCEDVEMYALGGLDEAEREAFKRHLQDCANCRREMAELSETIGLLPLGAEPVAIPEGMKERVLGRILGTADPTASSAAYEPEPASTQAHPTTVTLSGETATPPASGANVGSKPYIPVQDGAPRFELRGGDGRRTGRGGKWLNAVLAAAVLGLVFYVYSLREEVGQLNTALADRGNPAQGQQMNAAVALSPAAQDIVAQGLATILIDSSGTHLLVQAENLPDLKGNEAFQVWLVKGDQVLNAGTFYASGGKGGIVFTLGGGTADYDQIAITREPDAFGDAPRGTAVLAAALKT